MYDCLHQGSESILYYGQLDHAGQYCIMRSMMPKDTIAMICMSRTALDVVCEAVTSSWVSNMRYLGMHFVKSRTLKCSLDAAKRGFYRAAAAFSVKYEELPLRRSCYK